MQGQTVSKLVYLFFSNLILLLFEKESYLAEANLDFSLMNSFNEFMAIFG